MILSELIECLARHGPTEATVRVDPSLDLSTVDVRDLTDDSREVRPGTLFVARSGTKLDGRAFIPNAIAAGGVAILADEHAGPVQLPKGCAAPVLYASNVPSASAHLAEMLHGSPSTTLDLIGITGTNGKTTTAHLIHQLLNAGCGRCGLIGTVQIDDGRRIFPAVLTTPSSAEISRTLGVMVDAGCRAAVMEVSSHALDQGRVAALRYAAAIFTNLTGDHLDYHGSMESYAAAKARLFDMLPEHSSAIVNASDPWAERMVAKHASRGGSVIRCAIANPSASGGSSNTGNEAVATIKSTSMRGSLVAFDGPWGSVETSIRLVGRHNVMNMLQAIAAAWAVGVAPRDLGERASRAVAPAGRLEPVTDPRAPFAVLVDYAHTDDALEKVLTTLREVHDHPSDAAFHGEQGRILLVFGCGGDRDRTKRPRMGAVGTRLADLVFVTSDNPRTEAPRAIIDEVLAGVPAEHRSRVSVNEDRRAAIGQAIRAARPGDVVLIAGKGHETYQLTPDGKGGIVSNHFDDREEARAALRSVPSVVSESVEKRSGAA